MRYLTPARALIAIAALALAFLSLMATVSAVATRKYPELAVRFWPANGVAASRAGNMAVLAGIVLREKEPGSEEETMRTAAVWARRALDTLALDPVALRTIAIAEMEGEPDQRRVMRQAARLSRRDSLAQIWLINDAAMANDNSRALAHYDALLRRQTPFRDIAGRTLAHALSDKRFVGRIGGLLQQDPPWKTLLYHYALRDPAAWDGFIELHRTLRGAGRIPTDVSAQFAGALAAAGRLADASTVAKLAGAEPLTRADRLIDTRFETGAPFPGNWQVPEASGASLQPLAEGGVLLGYPRTRNGTVARRVIALEPGRYRADLTVDEDDAGPGAPDAEPEARLACAKTSEPGLGSATLEVGPDCPFQWLMIVLPAAPRYDGEAHIRAIEVERSGQS